MLRICKPLVYLFSVWLLVACTQGGWAPAPVDAPAATPTAAETATEAVSEEVTAAATEDAVEAPIDEATVEPTEEATEEVGEAATAEATEAVAEEATPEPTAEATEETAEETAEEAAAPRPPAADFSSPFNAEILKNLAYQLEGVGDEPVQLADGVYEDVENRILVQWVDTYALGDLNDEPAAAVILVANTGGSGTFSYLVVVAEREGAPAQVAATLLGDRVTMNWVTIANNEIELDLVTQGPDEPMCCATQRTFMAFVLEDAELVNIDTTVIGVQPQLTETEIITFVPEEVPETSEPGMCFSNAIGLGRADAWRCMTEDSLIYDPCFEVGEEATIVCGADPIIGELGFALELTEPLPAPDPGPVPNAWLVQLGDGTICGFATGTVPALADGVAPYLCTDEARSVLMDQFFEVGPVLYATSVVVELTDAGFVAISSVRIPVATIWR